MGTHTGTDQGNLANLVVVQHILTHAIYLQFFQQLHGAGTVGTRACEGDVGAVVLQGGNVLQHHVNVDLAIRQHAEYFRRLTGAILQAQHGDFRLGIIGCYTGEYCFFHGDILH